MQPLFFAKVLLFGEYGIIKDSMGLSVPYNFYKGTMIPGDGSAEGQESNGHLKRYAVYIEELDADSEFPVNFDVAQLNADLDQGMYFDSSIPMGYGVGSSGALVAAVYDKYATDKIEADDITRDQLKELKAILGRMESFFHGQSSGLDPLICYLNLPVLIDDKKEVNTVDLPKLEAGGKGAIFLVDSGMPGETEPMINIFFQKMKNEGFRKMLKQEFKHYNDACIQSFLKGEVKSLLHNIKDLSKLVLENFSPMIPSHFHKAWEDGIQSNAYYLKLCGSGGGGFVLGFTRDYDKARTLLSDYQTEVIYRF